MPTPVVIDETDLWYGGGDNYQGPFQNGSDLYTFLSFDSGPIIGIPGFVWKSSDGGSTWDDPDKANAYGWGGAAHWHDDGWIIASNNLHGSRIDLGSFDPATDTYTTRDVTGPIAASVISGIDYCFRLDTGQTVIFYRRKVSGSAKIFYIVHDGASWDTEQNWTVEDDAAGLTGFVMNAFIDASDRIHVLFNVADSGDSSTDVFYKRVNADLSLSAELTIESGLTGNDRASNAGKGVLDGSTIRFPVARSVDNPLEEWRINHADPPTFDSYQTIFTKYQSDDAVAGLFMVEADGVIYCWWLYSENEVLPDFDKQHVMFATLSGGSWSAETDWYNWETEPPDWTTWNSQMQTLYVARINGGWAVTSAIPYVHPVSGFNYTPGVFFLTPGGPFCGFGTGTLVSAGAAFAGGF